MSDEGTWDFGQADVLEPEAVGEPGQRTFRLCVMSGSEAASLWLEKEQLAALCFAIRQLLEQTGGEPQPDAVGSSAPDFPPQPDVDFRIGRLGIGYDEARRIVVIFAYDATTLAEEDEGGGDEESDKEPTFSCRASRSQVAHFADRAEDVINAGRPACALCGLPVDRNGHRCGRRNGHGDQPVSLT